MVKTATSLVLRGKSCGGLQPQKSTFFATFDFEVQNLKLPVSGTEKDLYYFVAPSNTRLLVPPGSPPLFGKKCSGPPDTGGVGQKIVTFDFMNFWRRNCSS